MNAFDRIIGSISKLMARIGGGLLLAAALLVAVEVLVRYGRIASLGLATELSSYALAVGATWALAYVVFERAHVRVDFITQRLPPLPKAILDIFAVASLAAIGLVLSLGGIEMVHTSLSLSARANTTLGTPLAIPQGAWTAGLVWFTAVAFYRSALAVRFFLRSDLASVTAIAGSPSTTEEVEEAIRESKELITEKA